MSNNITAAKAANTAYFDSSKGPNTITADQHAVLLNSTLDTAWNSPFIFEIGIASPNDGWIQFNNEDPLSVTVISFNKDLFGRYLSNRVNNLVVDFEDGSSVVYAKTKPTDTDEFYVVASSKGSLAFVIGQKIRITPYRTPYFGYSDTVVIQDSQFTDLTPQPFTSDTRSLLRNNGGLENGAIYGDVFWDSNQFNTAVSGEFHTPKALTIQTQFAVIPSSANINIVFEWDTNNALVSPKFTNAGYDHKKNVYMAGAGPLYFSEVFHVLNTDTARVFLTGDKDFEVYGCVHMISINRGD